MGSGSNTAPYSKDYSKWSSVTTYMEVGINVEYGGC